MSNSSLSSKSIGFSLTGALIASLCCITPVIAMFAGISGIAATFSWVEPIRPYLIALTVGILGFAWYLKLKPQKENPADCDCETDHQPSFWQSKKFLGIVTVFAGLMLFFPSYSKIFYPESINLGTLKSDNSKVIDFKVAGMTCSSCEEHIKYEVGQLPGVLSASASYVKENAIIKFDPSITSFEKIEDAINATGYRVVDSRFVDEIEIKDKTISITANDNNISFYQVPLVCNAAPTIGCGSRSKPILLDLEKANEITEAWLSRSGNTIAVVWLKETNFADRQKVVTEIFSAHKVNASMLMMEDYNSNLNSFKSGNGWLRGNDVDKLSREEADIISERILLTLKEEKKIENPSDIKALQKEISDVWFEWFLDFKDIEELGNPNVYRLKFERIIEIGEKYVGKGNMPDVETLFKSCSSSDCNHESCSNSSSCKVGKS